MGMSKQTAFTLTFLVGLSVLVPGSAGYLSARMDAVQRAYRDLVSLEGRLRDEQLLAQVSREPQIRAIAVPALPCQVPSRSHSKRKKARTPAALIPVPVQPLPPEAPPATSPPTEGLRIEPLPPDPEAAGPGRRIGSRYAPAEAGRGRARLAHPERDTGPGKIMIEQEAAPPIGPLRRIPSGFARPGLDREADHPAFGQETGPGAESETGGPRLDRRVDHGEPETGGPGLDRGVDRVEPGQAEDPVN